MSFRRVASRLVPPGEDSGASTPRDHDSAPLQSPGSRRQLTPEERAILSECWDPETLEWVLDHEELRLKDLVDMGLGKIPFPHNDDIDWSALEHSGSEEADITPSGPVDCYGVPLAPCYLCGKMDVGTRIITCGICCNRAHASCLHWTVREDPRKPGHYHWHCPAHKIVWFLEG